jgi:hypothetical protein
MRYLFFFALGAAFVGEAGAQAADTRPALQEALVSAAAKQGIGTQDAQLGLDPGVMMGKSVRYAFALKGGETYYVVGGCDANCSGVDLMMTDANSSGVDYDKDGEVVARTKGEAHPAFVLTAKKTSTYSIVIQVPECHGPGKTCVAGAAVFKKGAPIDAGWVRTAKFTIDPKGNVTLQKDFSAETFCVSDTSDKATGAALGEALAYNEPNQEANRKTKAALAACTAKYGWSERERELALTVTTTQALINYLVDRLELAGVEYGDVVEIAETLTTDQAKKFSDGSWQRDDVLVAKLGAALKGHGADDDKTLLSMGEMAIGSYANQAAAVRAWVDLLKPK